MLSGGSQCDRGMTGSGSRSLDVASGEAFRGLLAGFADSVRRFPDRDALVVSGRRLSYAELSAAARRWRCAIGVSGTTEPLIAILAARSATAYAGILGILASGRGYMPLNPRFPSQRLESMLSLSGCDVMIVGPEAYPVLPSLLEAHSGAVTVIVDDEDVERVRAQLPSRHSVAARGPAGGTREERGAEASLDDPAYLLFTSGSTGKPKGVLVTHGNVTSYIRHVCNLYRVDENDRISQHFDLTFDLSVHDMFVAWERGAALCCVPEKSLMMPAKFIRDHELSMWFSVPSLIGFMQRLRLLKPGAFQSLRWSLFCGEPLAVEHARAWQEAAPGSIVENLYGPTEATIAITRFRWESERRVDEHPGGIVPIGWPFAGQRTAVADGDGRTVPAGSEGELVLQGSQVTPGYFNDSDNTRRRFVELPLVGAGTWYRTGDVVRQREDGCLLYLGRVDQQVKIRGFRVELQEIEHVVRGAIKTGNVVAVPWPVRDGSADGVVVFLCAPDPIDEGRLIAHCRKALPDYMVPRSIEIVDEFPLNANGKIDRRGLIERLQGRGA